MSKENGKREMPKQPQSRGKKIAMIALAAVAGLAVTVFGAYKLLIVAPDVSDNDRPAMNQTGTTSKPNSNSNKDDSSTSKDGETDTTPLGGRKEDYYTFLLLGKDTGGGGNTDTMLLVSYDITNGTVDFMSIPRDTMINVTWSIKKINAVYASSRGIEGLKEEIGHLTGIIPDFHVIVEWEAIGEIVNALGGVWFDVPYNMNYDDPYQNLHIHQEKGYRLLDGDDAMQVIRWRKNNGSSGVGDTGRQQIQQDFLKAVAQQCLQIGNWTKISAFAEIFFNNIETDIPWNNLLWFAKQAMSMNLENINFHTLPGNDQGWYYTASLGSNLSYFFADPAGIVEMVNAHFNPYDRDITESDLQIMYKNKDGTLGVTNGVLAGKSGSSSSSSGSSGSSSSSGNTSSSGSSSNKGTSSSSGTSGSTSNTGSTGSSGNTNSSGSTSSSGSTGSTGTSGNTTSSGNSGSTGNTGNSGSTNTSGSTDNTGNTDNTETSTPPSNSDSETTPPDTDTDDSTTPPDTGDSDTDTPPSETEENDTPSSDSEPTDRDTAPDDTAGDTSGENTPPDAGTSAGDSTTSDEPSLPDEPTLPPEEPAAPPETSGDDTTAPTE